MDTVNCFQGLKAEYHTLGCKLNFAETSSIAAALKDIGFSTATEGEVPDVVLVNSCSVTAEADKKCRHLIRRLGRKYPEAAIVVTGCYSQLKHDEVAALPGVAVIAGNDSKGRIVEFIAEWMKGRSQIVDVRQGRRMRGFTPACSRGDRTRYFLKVQDGCDYFCTYCTIPFARGRSRSAPVASLVEMARNVAAEGGKEIVITGVNIGDFGKGTDETFFDLIRALDEVEGIERYRISSIEPNLLTDEIIQWLGHESRHFMPHFHIPLQAGSDRVLELMKRHYDTSLFRHRIEMINRVIPDAFIGVDIIAGARGETPELFEESKLFVESLDIAQLHVFPYSERPGTRALEIDYAVDAQEKHRRVAELMAVSNDKLHRFAERFVGQSRPVLVEHALKSDGELQGFTDNYLRLALPADYASRAGEIVNVEITRDNIIYE